MGLLMDIYIYRYAYILAALSSLKERVSPPCLEERGGLLPGGKRRPICTILPTRKGGPHPHLKGRGDSYSLP